METIYVILIITNVATLYALIGYALEVRTLKRMLKHRKYSPYDWSEVT